MEAILTMVPWAKVRSYEDVLKRWHKDQEFILNDIFSRWDGKYINRSQVTDAGYTVIKFRWQGGERYYDEVQDASQEGEKESKADSS